MKKRISILGSTGSIGTQCLDVIRHHSNHYSIVGLSCGKNIALFKQQLSEFKPEVAVIQQESDFLEMKHFISKHNLAITLLIGSEGLLNIASIKQDLVVISLVGTAGIKPTYAAIEANNNVGLACKEVLVSAGKIIMNLAKEKQVDVLPIDSEHAAIKQCLTGITDYKKMIHKLTITASGGPFWNFSLPQLQDIQPKDALNHPTWNMGQKITIDSSTLVNKGLEVIEAHYMFDIDYDQIDIVIHRQSIVHSLVEFIDGNCIAHLSSTDMRFPIQYALSYPEKLSSPWKRLSLTDNHMLTFEKPNHDLFPLLNVAFEVGKKGHTYPVVFNAANEAAVHLFLNNKISYLDIQKTIIETLSSFNHYQDPSIADIYTIDQDIKNSILHIHEI
ncbi:1-deoxy-D-xylulose-5-phosphate reductoisomerase [Candidatus Marinamargulisbacteria bacterium SCGC AG-414-C22]|nr:1-deoxy-D-xylulose-5-phosphate reductoisomerase [Candidatus Marinamargulisbacteria bacterium SCGC AG-414-C22]